MTKEELIEKLKAIKAEQVKNRISDSYCDPEADHLNADELLLEFINDPEVTKAFEYIEKWYA